MKKWLSTCLFFAAILSAAACLPGSTLVTTGENGNWNWPISDAAISGTAPGGSDGEVTITPVVDAAPPVVYADLVAWRDVGLPKPDKGVVVKKDVGGGGSSQCPPTGTTGTVVNTYAKNFTINRCDGSSVNLYSFCGNAKGVVIFLSSTS